MLCPARRNRVRPTFSRPFEFIAILSSPHLPTDLSQNFQTIGTGNLSNLGLRKAESIINLVTGTSLLQTTIGHRIASYRFSYGRQGTERTGGNALSDSWSSLTTEKDWTMPSTLSPSYFLFQLFFSNKSASIANIAEKTSNANALANWIIWSAFIPVIYWCGAICSAGFLAKHSFNNVLAVSLR